MTFDNSFLNSSDNIKYSFSQLFIINLFIIFIICSIERYKLEKQGKIYDYGGYLIEYPEIFKRSIFISMIMSLLTTFINNYN